MSDRDQEASSPRAEAIINQPTDEDHHHHHHHHHAAEQTEDQDASPPTTTPPPPPPPPPPLEPFFTLVTNTTTGSTTHPRVRYLFSDDDPSSVLPPDPAHDHDHSSSSSRPLIVDLVPAPDNAGWSVSWASSLSPDFALTGSSITVQHDGSHTAGDDKSTTLRLQGVERDPPDASRPGSLPSSGSGSGSGTALGREDVDSLADEFRRRMGVLRKVVGETEKRRFITEAQTGSPREREREREQHQGLQRQPQPEDDVAVEGESPGEKDAVRDSIRAEHAEAAGSTWG
ncbi:hypothetical protein EsDP_00005915 [Epichloe bromicola]|uniref:Uncharacterized protein n=1 Tax=Epichloe bromicola TaxID=79588 RepID=A0ABQ0CW52_9HYPO